MRKLRTNRSKASFALLFTSLLLVVPLVSLSFIPNPVTRPSNGSTDTYVYSPDGKGYLKTNADGKKLLHVEGSAYEMGYQHGFLLAEEVQYMTSVEMLTSIMMEFELGMTVSDLKSKVLDALTGLLGLIIEPEALEAFVDNNADFMMEMGKDYLMMPIINLNLKHVPEEFIEEMQGVADGATDAGYSTDLENILLLNMGVDAALSIINPIAAVLYTIPGLPEFIKDMIENLHACDDFIVHGDATSDGRVLMGRDFQLTYVGFSETSLLIEQIPDDGYSFVLCSTAGLIGPLSGMNSRGIGTGINLVVALDSSIEFGMGAALTCRKVLQYAGELSEAIDMVKNLKRGIPWMYAIGDGIGPEIGGAILEVTANNFYARRSNYKQPFWAPSPQIEAKDDVLSVSNHFLNPWMSLKTLSFSYTNTLWRYETLTNLILDNYGTIDVHKAWEITDNLHPPRYGYYGDDPYQTVKGSKSLMDLTNLDIYSLYGHYGDPLNFHSLD